MSEGKGKKSPPTPPPMPAKKKSSSSSVSAEGPGFGSKLGSLIGKLIWLALRMSWRFGPLLIIIGLLVLRVSVSVSQSNKDLKNFVSFMPQAGLVGATAAIALLTLSTFSFVGIDKSRFPERVLVDAGLPLVSWLILGLSIATMQEVRDVSMALAEAVSADKSE
jgi:hypothetical protein